MKEQAEESIIVGTAEMSSKGRFLVTMPYGIGDTVYIGLSAVDQILRNRPGANIDVLANRLQMQVLEDDPRINAIEVANDLSWTSQRRTWYKAVAITNSMRKMLPQLRDAHYDGIFPGNAAFGFLRATGSPLMLPRLGDLRRDAKELRQFGDAQASDRVRQIVNRFFADTEPKPNQGDPALLYIHADRFNQAREAIRMMKAESGSSRIILVAPDTASSLTRPPTDLLSNALGEILKTHPDTMVCILPSYTDTKASARLYNALLSHIDPNMKSRIFSWSKASQDLNHLLLLTGLADQADAVVTGDTGMMQLAISRKVVIDERGQTVDNIAHNKINTVGIFGATNPGLYGNAERMLIVGRGRPAQRRLRPGLFKEGYQSHANFFSHINSHDVAAQIENALAS